MSRKILLRSPLAWLIVLLVCGWCGSSAGQENPPRFLLTADGPVGTVQSMLFTPNSQRLLTAGSDKFVSLWGVRREGDDKALRVSLADRLFWEISRGERGHIYTMAIAPDGKYLAVAGVCGRASNGDIHIFSLADASYETVLKGHLQTTVSLAFSPDSKSLISVSKDGDARLWKVPAWTNEKIVGLGDGIASPRPVVFLSNTLAALAMKGTAEGSWSVGLYNLPQKRLTRLAQQHVVRVEALACDVASGTWASSDRSGKIYIWRIANNPTPVLLRNGRIARSLSFGPNKTLFVATGAGGNAPSYLEQWNLGANNKVDEVRTSQNDDNFACAVSPDGKYVATMHSDDGAIAVYPLLDAAAKAIAKPLSAPPVKVAGSAGPLWQVAFDKEKTYRVGMATKPSPDSKFGDAKETPVQAFDPVTLSAIALADHKTGWKTALDNSDGWSVAKLDTTGLKLKVTKAATTATISLDRSLQGPAECFTWLHDAAGKPYAIAIGTSQQCGIFVYELPKNGTCRLLRYYRDHYGTVTSLSCSTDGKILASSSVDGTVKLWSLNDLLAAGREFKGEAAWGAVLRPKGDTRLVVTKSDPAGIAVRRNLNVDDEIIRVEYVSQGKAANTAVAAEMLAALEKSPLWESVLLSVVTKGMGPTRRVLLTPAWEPLATLVLDRRGEWVMWTPQGYYDASVAGDELVGWILNGTDDRPAAKFFRADRFREQLEKPDVLKKLLTSRSLPAALETAKEPIPVNVQDRVTDIAKRLPTIKILKPQHDAVLAKGENIDVQVQVEFPNQDDVAAYDASLYINGIPVKDRQRTVKGGTANYQWQTAPPNQYNSLRIVAERTNNTRGGYADARVAVRSESDPKKGRLHFIGISAEKYSSKIAIPLPFCNSDVSSVAKLLRQSGGKYYEMDEKNFLFLRDQQVTPEAVRKLPTELVQKAGAIQPQDLLVVYLSGHGATISEFGVVDYYFIPLDDRITDEDQIRKYAISWDNIRAHRNPLPQGVFDRYLL